MGQAETERLQLLTLARYLRTEIEKMFTYVAHWNDSIRAPNEAPIDPDPDGRLRRMADGLDRTIRAEAMREVEAGDAD